MPTFKHVVRNFSGGILEDKRQQSASHFSITKHFDTFTYPSKLVPYAQTIASLGTATQSIASLDLVKFLYAPISSTLYKMFGFGVDPATGNTAYYVFDIDAGAANTTNWVAMVNGASSVAGRDLNVFFYYKGFIYNYAQGTTLQRADATSVASFNNNYQTISYTTGVQPVHHPSDDVAYFFGQNTVYSLNGTSWNGSALQLPTDQQITCARPFGNYLAIGTVTIGHADVQSTVYLWDRDTSLTTLTDRIDFGAGSLKYIASLNNKLLGVMNFYTDNLYSLNKGRVLIKQVSGEFGVTVNELTTDSLNSALPQTSIMKDNKLYFPMAAQLQGDSRLGIWALDENGKLALDTVEPLATSYDGIFSIGNMWWIAHSTNGSVTHTDASGTYSATTPSIWETLIFSTVSVTNRGTVIMNAATLKKLIGVTATFEALPAGASVTVKYRCDGATTWNTIFTYSTTNGTSHSAINIENTGTNLPTYNEIQFRVESLGGAVVTGLMYGGETVDNDLY